MLEDIHARLQHIGFSEKESQVYVALLNQGTATAQTIAKQTGISRSTVYAVAETLLQRGVISSVHQQGSTQYVAEAPQRLLAWSEQRVQEVREQSTRVSETIGALAVLFRQADGVPKARYFEGREALMQVREELWAMREPMWEAGSADERMGKVASMGEQQRLKLFERTRGGRLLLSVKSEQDVEHITPSEGFEVRTIDGASFPFSGALAVVGRFLCILIPDVPGAGILIESEDMARTFRSLYEAAWRLGKPYKRASN